MRRNFISALIALLALTGTASAHRIDEYLQATVLTLEPTRVDASMRLVPGVLVASDVIAAIDTDRNGAFSQQEQQAYAQQILSRVSIDIDGQAAQPKLLSWSFPQPAQIRAGIGEIHINYSANLPVGASNRQLVVANHNLASSPVFLMNVTVPDDRSLSILAQKRNPQQSIYEVDYSQASGSAMSRGADGLALLAWFEGLQISSLFRLGMRHIAEGTDHLLFLLTLLLPAPLLAVNRRWTQPLGVRESVLRILGIVTAFTIGHSITLALAALNIVHVPGHPIEVLIAISILVSAIHALTPIVPGKEAWIAGFFGLIHGLAFAATLDQLGLSHWNRVAGILSFNLGIESMQMIVVAAILPSLLLLSRTRVYPAFRICGALFAAIAAVGWIIERLWNVQLPVDTAVNALAHHAIAIAIVLLCSRLAFRLAQPNQPRPENAPDSSARIALAERNT